MENQLTQEQLKECKEAFSKFDKNGDGVISREELREIMDTMGQTPTDDELTDMLQKIDINNNGTIEFDEFLSMMLQKMKMKTRKQLKEAFATHDTNKSGSVSVKDAREIIRSVYEKLTEEEITKTLSQAGFDDDSSNVSLEDVVKLMESHETSQQKADTETFLHPTTSEAEATAD